MFFISVELLEWVGSAQTAFQSQKTNKLNNTIWMTNQGYCKKQEKHSLFSFYIAFFEI